MKIAWKMCIKNGNGMITEIDIDMQLEAKKVKQSRNMTQCQSFTMQRFQQTTYTPEYPTREPKKVIIKTEAFCSQLAI